MHCAQLIKMVSFIIAKTTLQGRRMKAWVVLLAMKVKVVVVGGGADERRITLNSTVAKWWRLMEWVEVVGFAVTVALVP